MPDPFAILQYFVFSNRLYINFYKGNPFVEGYIGAPNLRITGILNIIQGFSYYFHRVLNITHQEMGSSAGRWSLHDWVVPHTT